MKTRIPRAFFLFPVVAAAAAVLALPQAAWAQATDIAVLHSKVDHANLSIERVEGRLDRMDKRFDRMDERLDRMDERLARLEEIVIRLDERMNGFQMQNQFIVIPLLLLLVATMFGLLTKGILWGVERAPQASSGASRRGRPATQPTAVRANSTRQFRVTLPPMSFHPVRLSV